MQEHNREIMVYSCGGRCWSPACIQAPCSSEAFLRASACAFTTTLNHFATVVMFRNITPVTYGFPVSKMLTTSSGVTTGKSIQLYLPVVPLGNAFADH